MLRMAGGLACFSAMATCFLWGVTVGLDRVERVNERLPVDKRFEAFWWGPMKRWRFETEYVRLFPDLALRNKERLLLLLGAVSLAGFALCVAPLF